jgi:hypothetical protein
MPVHDEPDTPASVPDAASADEAGVADGGAPGDGAGTDEAPDAEAPARQVIRRPTRTLDPEDWASSGGDVDDRYLRDRPPHWQ